MIMRYLILSFILSISTVICANAQLPSNPWVTDSPKSDNKNYSNLQKNKQNTYSKHSHEENTLPPNPWILRSNQNQTETQMQKKTNTLNNKNNEGKL